jgi:hypothetical protein
MLAPSSPRKFAIFAVVAAIALAVLGFFLSVSCGQTLHATSHIH